MTQEQALNILKTGANVFLTGEPGAGKTHTINQYAGYLRARNIDPSITASTGIAATHLGGLTIHSWSGIGIRKYLDRYELDKIASTEYIAKRIRRAKVLVIDEVSMLGPETLDMVDMVCREIRQTHEAFGGLQVIFVGDFFQLPPVVRNQVSSTQQQITLLQTPQARFAYDSGAWQRAKPIVCYLTEQHRQDDDLFLGILSAIRSNSITDGHLAEINKRKVVDNKVYEKSVKLYTHNLDVDKTNEQMLGTVIGRPVTFDMNTKGSPALVAALQKGCLSPQKLILKVGAKVMFTKNNPKEGFVNGTLGVVESFSAQGGPALGWDNYMGYPVVRTNDGRKIVVEPMEWSVEENGKIKATIVQVPLRLAWAITVHKSQGMSLEEAVMDLSDVFEFGQGYVALSRVRRLSGLYLLGWNEQTFKVHPDVLRIDQNFRANSLAAQEAFSKIPAEELKVMRTNFIKACGGDEVPEELVATDPDSGGEVCYEPLTAKNYAEGLGKKKKAARTGKLAAIREKHPNAYKSWSPEQDSELKEFFANGVSIEEMAQTFGRKEGAICMRLIKLGLMEEET